MTVGCKADSSLKALTWQNWSGVYQICIFSVTIWYALISLSQATASSTFQKLIGWVVIMWFQSKLHMVALELSAWWKGIYVGQVLL